MPWTSHGRSTWRVALSAAPWVAAIAAAGCSGPPEKRQGDADLPRWAVDLTPEIVLGSVADDTTQLFSVVAGATRLPDGGVLVVDRPPPALHHFSADGLRLRTFGPRGGGPGEFGYPARSFRCGDAIIVYDIDGNRVSVFSPDGQYVRTFRFGTPPGQTVPYRSTCNGRGTFAHFGWARSVRASAPSRVYRDSVPFWIGGSDSTVRAVLGLYPGSERVLTLHPQTGRPTGSGPRRFGKQTAIALASDRLYIGTAERPEIIVLDLEGRETGIVRLDGIAHLLEQVDIEAQMQREIASHPPDRHTGIEREYATEPFPDSLPPYAALRIDLMDHLWVQDYPRASLPAVGWTVIDPAGVAVARVALPTFLEVFEIGADYVLGRYLDPGEGIPQVRLHRFHRGSAAVRRDIFGEDGGS